MRFQNKTVLITGSSRNTGLEVAAAFLKEGARVGLHGSSPVTVARGAITLRERGLTNFIEVPSDIGNKAEIDAMFATIRQEFGHLDILVNNAVDQCCGFPLETLTWERFAQTMQTNITGTFYISKLATEMMKEQKEGVIVNFSSNVSQRAIRNRIAYCTSKGGIDGLTIAMALDLAPYGIRVNSVAPGYINTERWDTLTEELKLRRRTNVPLGRESHGDTIADVVLFLASEQSRGMTGERIVVDGGCTRQLMPRDADV